MLKKTIRKVCVNFVRTKEFVRVLFENSFKKKKEREREINTIFPSKVNLTNRQLLEFARLVAGKIARLPTRRAVPSISKTGTEIRRFLSLSPFASFNYFHVKQAWFRANTERRGTAPLDPPLKFNEKPRYTFRRGMPRAYGIEKFHKNEPVWFSNYPPPPPPPPRCCLAPGIPRFVPSVKYRRAARYSPNVEINALLSSSKISRQ